MTREVFMPLMCGDSQPNSDQADKLMDVMHRIISQIAVTQSQIEVCELFTQINLVITDDCNPFFYQGLRVITVTGFNIASDSC